MFSPVLLHVIGLSEKLSFLLWDEKETHPNTVRLRIFVDWAYRV